MCNTIKKQKSEFGFSLIELAMVFVLVGLIVVPAIGLYHNYRVDKDWTETEENIAVNLNSVGGFRSVYGRYPCPASPTAVPSNLNYGREDCSINAPGTCNNGICTYDNATATEVVVVGVLPFKTLNIQESESYDNSENRFTYAVTRDLTVGATFDMAGGGVSIVDKNGVSIVEPPDSAHFAIVSHGPNKIGGYTRAGNQSATCDTGTLLEQENCDLDTVFLSGNIEEDFDDRIRYFSSIMPSEWQISADDPDEMHLKYTNSFAVGATAGSNLSAAEKGTVRSFLADEGNVRASGNFYSESLCEFDASGVIDCFAPRLIAGDLVWDGTRFEAETSLGSGMSCYKPSLLEDKYMVGIENGQLICEDEIFISCPDGSFIKGINANGTVKCDTAPEPRCMDMDIETTCGDDRTVLETYSGGYGYVYSGECRMITNYDAAYFATNLVGMDLDQAKAHIATLNAKDRAIEDCDSSASYSQVRDSYRCDAGTWSHISAHEKWQPWRNFDYLSKWVNWQPWPAETGYVGDDPDNDEGDHDCWCREDYKAVNGGACLGGLEGNKITIQKHKCPQTSHSWSNVYTSTEQCSCVDTTKVVSQSCHSYYNEITGINIPTGLSGIMTKTYDVTCVDGVPTQAATPSIIDVSACYCPSYSQKVTKEKCTPAGTTNSWTWITTPQTGVASLTTEDWSCPATTTTISAPPATTVLPPSRQIPDPGSWGDVTPYEPIPECVCDSDLTDEVTEACAPHLTGLGMKYEKEWDCTISNWEPKEEWELIDDQCNTCSVKKPQGAGTIMGVASLGYSPGESCNCSEDTVEFCYENLTEESARVWSNCPCNAI